MRKVYVLLFLLLSAQGAHPQGYGIVRKNYFTTIYDSIFNITYDQFDSATIRMGEIDPLTGLVSNLNASEYSLAINLTGATVNPYNNEYYISSGSNLLTFNMGSGDLINTAPISGPYQTFAFQNYRFNPSDSVIYGLVPNNYYSIVYDSLSGTFIQILDSSVIKFATINPVTGTYSPLGNSSFKNVYTLAGNSIDPHQMLYYYSAVDTLIGIDLYTGNVYSQIPIQLPANALFENFTYSCSDTSIYGLTRQNYISTYYDSILQMYIDVYDSTTIRLSKIDPLTGLVTIISPVNLGLYASLNGSCYIDPGSLTYFFSTGTDLIGVSLLTGLITSAQTMNFQSGAISFDMMRSKENCLFASKVRLNTTTEISENSNGRFEFTIQPNPVTDVLMISTTMVNPLLEVIDVNGKTVRSGRETTFSVSELPSGFYLVRASGQSGEAYSAKFLKR